MLGEKFDREATEWPGLLDLTGITGTIRNLQHTTMSAQQS